MGMDVPGGIWSEEDGTYELRGVVFSEIALEFGKKGHSSTQRTVPAGHDDQTINVELSK